MFLVEGTVCNNAKGYMYVCIYAPVPSDVATANALGL